MYLIVSAMLNFKTSPIAVNSFRKRVNFASTYLTRSYAPQLL